jgi:hypothetical protein
LERQFHLACFVFDSVVEAIAAREVVTDVRGQGKNRRPTLDIRIANAIRDQYREAVADELRRYSGRLRERKRAPVLLTAASAGPTDREELYGRLRLGAINPG